MPLVNEAEEGAVHIIKANRDVINFPWELEDKPWSMIVNGAKFALAKVSYTSSDLTAPLSAQDGQWDLHFMVGGGLAPGEPPVFAVEGINFDQFFTEGFDWPQLHPTMNAHLQEVGVTLFGSEALTGEIVLHGLEETPLPSEGRLNFASRESHMYVLYEALTPEGFALPFEYRIPALFIVVDGLPRFYAIFDGLDLSPEYPGGLFPNEPYQDSLYLHKSDLGNKPLPGASFVVGRVLEYSPVVPPETLYLKDLGDQPNPFVPRLPDYVRYAVYTTDINEAKRFVSDEYGNVVVAHLPLRDELKDDREMLPITHFVEEVAPPPGYASDPNPENNRVEFQVNEPKQAGYINDKGQSVTTNYRLPGYVHMRNTPLGALPLELSFNKKLVDDQGKALPVSEGQFTFELLRDGEVIATASNEATGLVQMEPVWLDVLQIDQPEQLMLREQIPDVSTGIAYDRRVHTLEVMFRHPAPPAAAGQAAGARLAPQGGMARRLSALAGPAAREAEPVRLISSAASRAIPPTQLRAPVPEDEGLLLELIFVGEPSFLAGDAFINKLGNAVDFTVTKRWEGGPEPHPDIEMQLTQDGEPYGDPVVLKAGQISHTWQDLPRYRPDSDFSLPPDQWLLHEYAATEIPVPGYSQTWSADGSQVTNSYLHTWPELAFEANKQYEGGSLTAGQFSFELLDGQDNVLQTQTNGAYGSVVFEPIPFQREGEHQFVIREVEGMTWASATTQRATGSR